MPLPIGLSLQQAQKQVQQAFEAALVAEGGSPSTWLVLLAVKTGGAANQRGLADQLGLRQPTITHHLAGMEAAGLLRRERDPGNRRAQQVTLTDDGEALFHRLRKVAQRFDQRLRRGIDDAELDAFRAVLDRLVANAAG
jgi:MarR family transcriptional regulator for hemolysin